jgi:hypothetical protein
MTNLVKSTETWFPTKQYNIDLLVGIPKDIAYYACPVVEYNNKLYIAENYDKQPIINIPPDEAPNEWKLYFDGQSSGVATVNEGGTGVNQLTPYALIAGGITNLSNIQQLPLGTFNQYLRNNGANQLPSWEDIPSSGITEVIGSQGNGYKIEVLNQTTVPEVEFILQTAGILVGDNGALRQAELTDYPTFNQNTTGNADTSTLAANATKLATARQIYGNPFDGTLNINGPVKPGYGGSGLATYTANSLLLSPSATGNSFQQVPLDTAGKVLFSNGVDVLPSWEPLPTGTGSVSHVSGINTNGVIWDITNPTTTVSQTISFSATGMVKVESGALVNAIAGSDYVIPSGTVQNSNVSLQTNKLTTARQILGVPFDGTANRNSPVLVNYGGTGLNEVIAYGLIFGGTTATSQFQTLTNGPTGYALISTGINSLPSWQPISSGGGLSSINISSTNGFAGTTTITGSVATLELKTTISGLIKGNGTTLEEAVAGSDYVIPTGNVATATALANSVTLWGHTFNGTQNLSAPISTEFGGTGLDAATPFALLAGGTTTTGDLQYLPLGTDGQILVSNGPGVLSSWQDIEITGTGIDNYHPDKPYIPGEYISGNGTYGLNGAIYVAVVSNTGIFNLSDWGCITYNDLTQSNVVNSFTNTFTMPVAITGTLNNINGYNSGTCIEFAGNNNNIFGSNSFKATGNINANNNTGIGNNCVNSGLLDDAEFNSWLGNEALNGLTKGKYNLGLSYKAGELIDEGNNNIIIGGFQGLPGTSYNNNFVIADVENGNELINISNINTAIAANQILATPINNSGALSPRDIIPKYTTTAKNALTVSAGTMIYDTDLNKMCFYNGTTWETITSS